MNTLLQEHHLLQSAEWLRASIAFRLQNPDSPLPESLKQYGEGVDALWSEWGLDPYALTVFHLALAPYIDPGLLDATIRSVLPEAGDFPEMGGLRGKQHRGFLPTGETALYLLGGEHLGMRAEAMRVFGPQHFFAQKRILWLEPAPAGEPALAGRLVLNSELVENLLLGEIPPPRFSKEFPAERIETSLDWDDLIVDAATRADLDYLFSWLSHGHDLLQDERLGKRIAPGFRALFYGPPGTGKTLAASLLGQKANKPVYRVDLASVVSKYIGETEKNLSGLFARAEDKDWILFFDEADALFGKRTNVKEAKDRFANQEVAYLLQRVERYPGLVILASNYKSNIDDAFLRRFQSVIHFPLPGPSERLALWKASLPDKLKLSPEVNLLDLANRYEFTGADIVQVIHYAAIQAMQQGDGIIHPEHLAGGIRREMRKAGRV